MYRLARVIKRPLLFGLLLIITCFLSFLGHPSSALATSSAPPPIAALPAALPTHFSFGIMDGQGGANYLAAMRTQNGTAWDYHYTYLSAGVNTGHGWATWNAPAGQYATYFIQSNQANGFMTGFVYYLMLQSSGPGGNGEAATDLAHLADPTLMNAYYADWALLMQKIGASGAPVLVVVEPDLWGYIEQAAVLNGSNSAASVTASVASSGYADAQGLPNTAQGFAWALLKIRDHYAHSAILALHASSWGTRTDIAGNTSPSINAVAVGTQEGQFLQTAGLVGNPAGISTFDLISNDIADHDSGQSGNWWDKNNVTYPNFTRYLQYIHTLSVAAGRAVIMWQVPVANQYFDTENNSTGHTQDNRAEYILAHIPDFANAGVIGVLFGPGNGGTNVFDNQNDGITNPVPINTPGCNLCNNHQSAYADDDGGYLRLTLGQYYKSGAYPLSGGAFTPPNLPTTVPATTIPGTHVPTPGATPSSTRVALSTATAPGASAATPSAVAVIGISVSTRTHRPEDQAPLSTSGWIPLVIVLLLLVAASVAGFIWRRRRPDGVLVASQKPADAEMAPDHWGFGITGQYPLPDVDETWESGEPFKMPPPSSTIRNEPERPPTHWREPGERR